MSKNEAMRSLTWQFPKQGKMFKNGTTQTVVRIKEKSPQRLHLCEAVGWIRDFSDWAATAGLSEPEKQVDLGRTD